MVSHQEPLRRLGWALVALQSCWLGALASLLEVDIVFPRNGSTYAPDALLPVVLAIQNPGFVPSVNGTPGWQLYAVNSTSTDFVPPLNTSHAFQNYTGSSTNGTYFMWSTLGSHVAGEGTWYVNWIWTMKNCSMNENNRVSGPKTEITFGTTFFNTKKGAPAADLQGVADTCTNQDLPVLAQNVTSKIIFEPGAIYKNETYCSVLSPLTSLNPCGAQIGSSDASAIASAIMASNCAAAHPLVPCTTASSTTSAPTAAASQSDAPHENGAVGAVSGQAYRLVLFSVAAWLGSSLFLY